jgi:hypothetical protein
MMTMRWILTVLMLLVLGSAPAAAQDITGPFSAVSGTLTRVDHELGTLELEGNAFHVSAGSGLLNELAPGMSVVIHYKLVDGQRVVTEIELWNPR